MFVANLKKTRDNECTAQHSQCTVHTLKTVQTIRETAKTKREKNAVCLLAYANVRKQTRYHSLVGQRLLCLIDV